MSHKSVAVRAHGAAGSPSARRGRPALTGPGYRVLLLAGRREALWLARSPLVLAGLAVAAWLIWLNDRVHVFAYGGTQLTFWWYADVSIVACLLAAGGGVLMAAQLAASRARRDQMEQLYASYPASTAVRTGAQLVSVTGPVVLAVAVTGIAWAWLDSNGTLGAPRLWVLGAGLLLIAAAGTIGVALGTWLGHPMAGILVVLALGLIEINLTLSVANPVHLPGGTAWLFPWSDPGSVLATLPGMTVPYPPPAHLAELAALIALAVVAALWRFPAALAAFLGGGVLSPRWLSRPSASPAGAAGRRPGPCQARYWPRWSGKRHSLPGSRHASGSGQSGTATTRRSLRSCANGRSRSRAS